MTQPSKSRRPRAFAPDDPAISAASEPVPQDATDEPGLSAQNPSASSQTLRRPTALDLSRGIRWGGLLITGVLGLIVLSTTLWFTSFVEVALARQDWVGWFALGLLGLVALSALVIVLREIVGLFRLARLGRLKHEVTEALSARDLKRERAAVHGLTNILSQRADLHWALTRFGEHERAVLKPGDLLALADRELMMPLDQEARRVVLTAAKRVGIVTAMSPMAWIAMLYVLIENVRTLRALAGLYGGRPGSLGALRLARMVVGHIIATGGVALTDDLLGQFLGQDLLRRLSRRLGEGAFNGALTARVGAAAVEVCRPLPFITAPPIRARDMLAELFRRSDNVHKSND